LPEFVSAFSQRLPGFPFCTEVCCVFDGPTWGLLVGKLMWASGDPGASRASGVPSGEVRFAYAS
jgi:hypothetical protein